MKQGTGKTRVALEIAESTDSTLILFLVPNSLKHNIIEEIKKWKLSLQYIIETYEGISQSDKRYLKLLDDLQNEKVMIIADESVFIKNGQAKRYSRILKIRDLSEYRLILNGTPITKNEWDIYYQMKFLSDKIINMDESEFLHTFFKKIKFKRKNEREKEFYKLSDVNIDYLKRLIEPYVYEVDLELDIKENITRKTILSSEVTDAKYAELKKQLLEVIEFAEETTIVSMLSNIQYVTFTDEERCIEIAKDLQNIGQSIVFNTYRKEQDIISSYLDCYVINGDTSSDERNVIINQFKNDNKPLLMIFGVGAFGHNFQFTNKLAFTSLTFDYGKIEQAEYRIKRLGQKREIEYIHYESNLGIYHMIKENIEKKRYLHDTIIRDLSRIKELL